MLVSYVAEYNSDPGWLTLILLNPRATGVYDGRKGRLPLQHTQLHVAVYTPAIHFVGATATGGAKGPPVSAMVIQQ